MLEFIVFNPVMAFTGAVGAAAILAPVLLKPGRFKMVCACIVLAPISPFLALAWFGAKLIAIAHAVESRWPGAAWAARIISNADRPGAEIIPFNPNRAKRRK